MVGVWGVVYKSMLICIKKAAMDKDLHIIGMIFSENFTTYEHPLSQGVAPEQC